MPLGPFLPWQGSSREDGKKLPVSGQLGEESENLILEVERPGFHPLVSPLEPDPARSPPLRSPSTSQLPAQFSVSAEAVKDELRERGRAFLCSGQQS